LAIALLVFLAPESWAHKANVFAYVEGDRIVAEGYFSGKAKAIECAIEILNADGNKIHEGKTDANGVYAVKIADLPRMSGDLKIVLRTGDGHKAEYTLKGDDLTGSVVAADRAERTPTTEAQKEHFAAPLQIQDSNQLRKSLDEIIDAKIQPLMKMLAGQQRLLAEQKDRSVRLIDIIGGIGWIFGLVGVWAYFKGRKQTGKS
jgi:nickel transport protein